MTLKLFEESDFEGLTCSREAFPVSPTLSQGSEWARKMTALSGARCCELSEKPSLVGLLAKTLLESSQWGSSVCYMNWKKQGISAKHSLYRLALSTPRINEIGFGWLPTPTKGDGERGAHKNAELVNGSFIKASKTTGTLWGATLASAVKLLPTVRVSSANGSSAKEILDGNPKRRLEANFGLESVGKTLNPAFVEALMGYPENWTLLDESPRSETP